MSEQEDRGTHTAIWLQWVQCGGSWCSFAPIYDWDRRYVISVPFGYWPYFDPETGAVLRTVFGVKVTAREALEWALAARQGWRLISLEDS